ncbi:hypothetical protein C0991_012283 [Blastosporella zonata]|nr:hypothetical protein C0991_012283 [Blastosporella zonata]
MLVFRDQLSKQAIELAELNMVAYNCQGDLTNLENKVEQQGQGLRHLGTDMEAVLGMMEEYEARILALEDRLRSLEGQAGVEGEGEPAGKSSCTVLDLYDLRDSNMSPYYAGRFNAGWAILGEEMLPRDQDAGDMETSADELKTGVEYDTATSEDKQTRRSRWDMEHKEAEKQLLAAVARLSTAPVTVPLVPAAATADTTAAADETGQRAHGASANDAHIATGDEQRGEKDMEISDNELAEQTRIAEERDIEDHKAEKQMLAAMVAAQQHFPLRPTGPAVGNTPPPNLDGFTETAAAAPGDDLAAGKLGITTPTSAGVDAVISAPISSAAGDAVGKGAKMDNAAPSADIVTEGEGHPAASAVFSAGTPGTPEPPSPTLVVIPLTPETELPGKLPCAPIHGSCRARCHVPKSGLAAPAHGDNLDDPQDPDFKDWVDQMYGLMHIIQPTIPHTSIILQSTIDPNATLPLPISIQNTNEPTPVINDKTDLTYNHVPCSESAIQEEQRLQLVRLWLKTLEQPKDILDLDYASLICYATSFFKDGD